jgi:hypothetical protein
VSRRLLELAGPLADLAHQPAHRLQVRAEALALVEPLLLGPVAGQHRALPLEHIAAHVDEVRRPHHCPEWVAVAVRLRMVDGDRPFHRRRRGVGRHIAHSADEGGRDGKAAGVLVVLHVVARRVRQQDVRSDPPDQSGKSRQGAALVEHREVIHQALVQRKPHEVAGFPRLGAAHADSLLPPVDARSAAPVRDGEAVDLVADTLQPQQRARRHELHVVGVRENGERDSHGGIPRVAQETPETTWIQAPGEAAHRAQSPHPGASGATGGRSSQPARPRNRRRTPRIAPRTMADGQEW